MKRPIWMAIMIALDACVVDAVPVELVYTFTDKRTEKKMIEVVPDAQGVANVLIKREELPAGLATLDVLPDFASARVGEEGYFIMPNGEMGTFRERNGERTSQNFMPMPVFGMKNPRATFVAIVTGMQHSFTLVSQAKEGVYTIFPRFQLRFDPPAEDIAIAYHLLSGDQADYCGMARAYRNYQLGRKACVPLKERMKSRPELAYATTALAVRIRNGWKPMPTPVTNQTYATEPPMKVAVTFDRVGDILDEFKRQGVDRAEICLVGWNRMGHDGRFPELFPVEEQLGGESKLRQLIKKAQDMGFQIVCHSNSHDAYMIAETWDAEYIVKGVDGTSFTNYQVYGGGRVFPICPQRAFERFAQKELREIADLGFRGLHYNDILTVVQPKRCFDPRHPLTRRQSAYWIGKILGEARAVMGGSASEGGHDFCCGQLDYALYASVPAPKPDPIPLVDRFVPFWQLVYHGIIMGNPFPTTCNYTIKDPATRLMLTEFGGRPFFYFYSNYRDNGDAWMGVEDLTCADDAALAASVAKVKEGYDEYAELSYLQPFFMDRHEAIGRDVYRIVYSDGSEIVCNYRQEPFVCRGRTIPPMKYLLFKPDSGQ